MVEILRDRGINFPDEAQFIDHARHQATVAERVTRVAALVGCAGKIGGWHRSNQLEGVRNDDFKGKVRNGKKRQI